MGQPISARLPPCRPHQVSSASASSQRSGERHNRSLAEVRLEAGIERHDPISVSDLIEEVEIGAVMQAQARALTLQFTSVDRTLT